VGQILYATVLSNLAVLKRTPISLASISHQYTSSQVAEHTAKGEQR
jgi:hypothetical protein